MAGILARGNTLPFRSGVAGVIELSDDFRDLLIELADAGADFVVVAGMLLPSTATRGQPKTWMLWRAEAQRVYRALAAFGAPLEDFDVTEADFTQYEGVLQIGLPPRRIDILNRATGITFDEAIADGAAFMLEGRQVRVIGLQALLENKRATRREQDLADVKALEPRKP